MTFVFWGLLFISALIYFVFAGFYQVSVFFKDEPMRIITLARVEYKRGTQAAKHGFPLAPNIDVAADPFTDPRRLFGKFAIVPRFYVDAYVNKQTNKQMH